MGYTMKILTHRERRDISTLFYPLLSWTRKPAYSWDRLVIPPFSVSQYLHCVTQEAKKIFYPRIRRPVFDLFQLIGKRGIFPPYFTPFCLGLENQPILGIDG